MSVFLAIGAVAKLQGAQPGASNNPKDGGAALVPGNLQEKNAHKSKKDMKNKPRWNDGPKEDS